MSISLSVCLLTRDEERNLDRAIRSVQEVADEVIVADTGSTDRTVEIARERGARVVAVSWDDDFAAGRNAAIEHASGDWILWLNPDEELLPATGDSVRSYIAAGDDVFGYLVRVQNVLRADRLDQFTESWDLRLYRRRPDVRYLGRLHPSFDPELAQTLAGEGTRVEPSGLILRRLAYASVLDESKLRWAVRLLERELRDRPGRLHYLIEYGRNLLMLGDPNGHEVMAEAIEQIRPALGDPTPPSPDVQLLLEYILKTPPEQYRGSITPAQALSQAPRWYPNSPPLLWAMAESYAQAQQLRAAVVLLERLLQLGNTGQYDRSHGFDPRIMGPWALLNLGKCHRAMGETDKACRCFEALLHDPDFGADASAALTEIRGPITGA